MEIIKNIYNKQGIRGFFKGSKYVILSSPIFYGTYLPLYSYFKKKYIIDSSSTAIIKATAISYLCSSLLVNPIIVLRTRIQNKLVFNSNTSFSSILYNEGIRGLFRGYGITVFKGCELLIQMPIQEKLNEYVPIPIASFISRSIGITATYPLETIRVKVRNESKPFKEIINGMLRNPHSFYRGYVIYNIKSSLKSAIIFSMYSLLSNKQ
jgi:hypothetical protein